MEEYYVRLNEQNDALLTQQDQIEQLRRVLYDTTTLLTHTQQPTSAYSNFISFTSKALSFLLTDIILKFIQTLFILQVLKDFIIQS